ncbi:topoisomerase II-associated protein PAT1-domain-containing protein [Kickxella alabastrina]|uniref:topoisomerase II-associated protein PAT1-domain-containing protein n=1 Tax=Kickxella alabastrina TaxID=61397 RepID=UPI00221E3FD7|nr:topoisomerase II-associated protein PAT1-domain-containing protein [Kickxella alabastrina]KAI7824222.1 topoisomerase II-associated protein PAT1-domain-containing protein [Kickxella alabastrina]
MSGSFFGTGFGFPDDAIALGRDSFRHMEANHDLDARLESMVLEGEELGGQLDENLDNFNDETFEADVKEISGKEFDFQQYAMQHQAKVPQQQQHSQPMASGGQLDGGRMMTLAEVEAQIVQQRVQVQQGGRRMADPEVIAQRREARLNRQMELSKYDNMMSRHDKDYIIRIQVSQLLTDDPAADDFYCHMYQLSRGAMFNPGVVQTVGRNISGSATPRSSAGTPGPSNAMQGDYQHHQQQHQQQHQHQNQHQHQQPENHPNRPPNSQGSNDSRRPGSSLSHTMHQQQQHLGRTHRSNTQSSMARMQQQVQRIVNEARRRPKAAHVAAEGALGKISVNSARNPKQVIQVQQRSHSGSISLHSDIPKHSPSTHDLGGIFSGLGDTRNPAGERRKTLRSIENVYSAVLRLEQMIREQVRLPPNADHPAVQNWLSNYTEAKEKAWAELDASQPISNTYPHPLVRFLSFSKGKRIVPRLVHHLTIDQVLALTTTVIANFETLDVCRFGSFSYSAAGSLVAMRQREETDLFLHAVMPPTLAFLSETSLQIVNGLFALFMERNNIAWVARTRPALVFLTVLLGRSAALKQGGAHAFGMPADAQEVYQAAELYNHLFNSLRGNLVSIFPPPSSPALGHTMSPMEDLHAWQFLATLAIGASVEQQHTLVSEVREKVLEKVVLAKSGHLPMDIATALTANVNLFLNALGLDASQVAT